MDVRKGNRVDKMLNKCLRKERRMMHLILQVSYQKTFQSKKFQD